MEDTTIKNEVVKGIIMANEFLKDILSEDTYNKVCEEIKDKDIKLANLAGGDYVSKSKYTALESQYNSVNELLTNKTAEYDALKEKAGDNKALQTEIENLKSGFETEKANLKAEFTAQLKKSTIENAIITGYKPHDVKDVLNYVDVDKITVDDNGVTGLKEQMESLKENKSYLFVTESNGDEGNKKGGLSHDNGGEYNSEALRRAFGIKDKK